MLEPVVLSGGTGLIGRRIVPRLSETMSPRLLTRRPPSADPTDAALVAWDGLHCPAAALDGARAVIHLAGEPIFGGLPTKARLARLWSSRVDSTRNLVDAIRQRPAAERPDTFVCASAVGYYGDRGEELLPETAPAGTGFFAELCAAWEDAAEQGRALGMRVVQLRFGIVLARGGGALGLMGPVFKSGLAGRLGTGKQWFPWVHIDDAARWVVRAVSDEAIDGAINVVAPEPVRNEELTRVLAAQLRRPAFMVAPSFAIRAALGPLSSELLGSKRVVAERAEQLGVAFQHETLTSALAREFA
jgi:hypothetical protein